MVSCRRCAAKGLLSPSLRRVTRRSTLSWLPVSFYRPVWIRLTGWGSDWHADSAGRVQYEFPAQEKPSAVVIDCLRSYWSRVMAVGGGGDDDGAWCSKFRQASWRRLSSFRKVFQRPGHRA